MTLYSKIRRDLIMTKTLQRKGDGRVIEMTEDEIRKDVEEGTNDAADRGEIPPLTRDEIEHVVDIYTRPERIVSVEPGSEVVLSHDEGTVKINAGVCGGAGLGIDCGRMVASELYERALGADIIEYGHIDYSWKPIRPLVADERILVERTLLVTTAPFLYGAMPNLGLYTQPDGPFPNPTELLNKGKINEARESGEGMIEHAVNDMVYIAGGIYEAGADAINFDTTGAFGDLDFAAALQAAEILKKKYPGICIEMGMAGEFVLGIHGAVTYDGVRLAGLWPHQQVKLAEKAGVTIFGPVVNIVTSRSCPWNIARVITFAKACVQESQIPIHSNMGMGVGGVPLSDTPPVDAVTRASKAAVEICKLDGL
jgi:dimethylamine--corrinoid protein Co-methyltransferase